MGYVQTDTLLAVDRFMTITTKIDVGLKKLVKDWNTQILHMQSVYYNSNNKRMYRYYLPNSLY